jgi:hypothetical protein
MSTQKHPLVKYRANYNPVSLSKAIERENKRSFTHVFDEEGPALAPIVVEGRPAV